MTLGPGNRHHQHQAQPSQATGLDDIAMTGPDRITVNAAGSDPGAATALDGVVQRHEQGAWRGEGVDECHEQAPARLQG